MISVSSFASSEGGIILKNWYDRAVGYAVEDAASELLSGAIGLNRTINQENKGQLDDAEDELGNLSTLITEHSGIEVQNYQQHYIKVANDTEENLKKRNFSDLKKDETAKLETEIEADVGQILAEILQ